MFRTEYITPWVRMRAGMEHTLKAAKKYPVIPIETLIPIQGNLKGTGGNQCTHVHSLKWIKETCLFQQLEPFASRHSISYFNNNKEDSTGSAYKRLHSMEDFDPSKPRCDRTKASLYWLEISEENKGHKVPMTANHCYGRPNRIQVDVPEKKFNRLSKMQAFYRRCGIKLISDSDERQAKIC